MPTYRIEIEYDGTDWHGWQSQPDHRTIQDAIEGALSTALRQRVSIVGSGRTDAGVHAIGQVAHTVLPEPVDTVHLARSLNGILPNSIAIRGMALAAESFHARYDAVLRTYRYQVNCTPMALGRIYRWHVLPPPDFDKMNTAAKRLLGKHDFSSFCRSASETRNRFCSLEQASWMADDREGEWSFVIAADRFLHGMVRSIVGTLMEVGHGNRSIEDLSTIMSAHDRRAAGFAAPAHGLILEKVEYP